MNRSWFVINRSLLISLLAFTAGCGASTVGMFENQADIGQVQVRGSIAYDPASDSYTITGGGFNIWGQEDAFFFAWNQTDSDLTLIADVDWPEGEKLTHRKAGWMIRQGLEADDPYVDAVAHGDGLICLQFRPEKGADTQDISFPVKTKARMKLDRDGDVYSLSISQDGGDFQPVGSVSIPLTNPVNVGLAVCSHEAGLLETALLTNVSYEERGPAKGPDRITESTLEIIDPETKVRRIVYRAKEHFEAPNWSRDGKTLIFNQDGKIFQIPAEGGTPEQIDTGDAVHCNNDHGLSPDGKQLVVSDAHEGRGSLIYVLPADGGTPKLVTPNAPSYWHGWSPDGKTLAYCAERNGNYDIYTIPVTGGTETRLTDAEGLDDGPDYSPDGKYIYLNSVRTGLMKIWRMKADGSEQTQMTFGDEYGDWFPHPSPDGKKIIFVSFDSSVEGHPANKNVALRMMPADGGEPVVLARFFGGQGTINVPSWSPDSKEVAFVTYRLVKP